MQTEQQLRQEMRDTEAGKLLVRYGFEPYDTESSARRVAEKAAEDLAALVEQAKTYDRLRIGAIEAAQKAASRIAALAEAGDGEKLALQACRAFLPFDGSPCGTTTDLYAAIAAWDAAKSAAPAFTEDTQRMNWLDGHTACNGRIDLACSIYSETPRNVAFRDAVDIARKSNGTL